jgi:hypothetical protein
MKGYLDEAIELYAKILEIDPNAACSLQLGPCIHAEGDA